MSALLANMARQLILDPRGMDKFRIFRDVLIDDAGECEALRGLDLAIASGPPKVLNGFRLVRHGAERTEAGGLNRWFEPSNEGVHEFQTLVAYDSDISEFHESWSLPLYHAVVSFLAGRTIDGNRPDPRTMPQAKKDYSKRLSPRQASSGRYVIAGRVPLQAVLVMEEEVAWYVFEDVYNGDLLDTQIPVQTIPWEQVPKDLLNTLVVFSCRKSPEADQLAGVRVFSSVVVAARAIAGFEHLVLWGTGFMRHGRHKQSVVTELSELLGRNMPKDFRAVVVRALEQLRALG